jgi:hypothetical protein
MIEISDGFANIGDVLFLVTAINHHGEDNGNVVLQGTLTTHRLVGKEVLMIQGHTFPEEIAKQIVFLDKRKAIMAHKLQKSLY